MGGNKDPVAGNSRLQRALFFAGFLALLYLMLTIAQISRDTIIALPYSDHSALNSRQLQSINLTSMLPTNVTTKMPVTNDTCNCNCSCCTSQLDVISKEKQTSQTAKTVKKATPKPGTNKPQNSKKPKQPLTIPDPIKNELKKYTIVRSLKNYSVQLYERARLAISLINTTETRKVARAQKTQYIAQHSLGVSKFVFNHNLVICNAAESTEARLALFTTIFHSESKQYLFNNTITNYALLKPKILPVLFISDMNTVEYSGYLIDRACTLGWIVSAAPRRTKFGFPILNSMYFQTMHLSTANWVGYSNADILFTSRLPAVLDYLQTTPSMANFSFISSKRTNVYIPPGKNIRSLHEAMNLTKSPTAQVHKAYAIDYFLYRRDAPLLKNMPDFCIGRRGYDNWLIYHQVVKQIPSLDVTAASPAIHIAIGGVSFKANSHSSQAAEKDYNINLANGQNWYIGGYTSCLSHGLSYVAPKIQTGAQNTQSTFTVSGPGGRGCTVHAEKGALVRNSRRTAKKKA